MKDWQKFDSKVVLDQLGIGKEIKVKGVGRPETPAIINHHGQALNPETGHLLPFEPDQMLLPEDAPAPAAAGKPSSP